MSKARQLADLLDSGGDVVIGALDNAPASDWNTLLNVPSHATVDTTNAANVSSGILPIARLASGSGSSGQYLRGDMTWQAACTNYPNCSSSNCVCACACNC